MSTAPQAEYLTGKLIIAGDVELDEGEIAPGVVIAIQREILRAVKVMPMYQQVAVVPVDDLAQLRAEIASVTAELQAAKDWVLNDSKTIGELRSDLASLRVSYEQNAHQCVEINRELARVTEERDGARGELTKYASDHRKICYSQEVAITALRARVARAEAATPAKHPDTVRLNQRSIQLMAYDSLSNKWEPVIFEDVDLREAIDLALKNGKARHD